MTTLRLTAAQAMVHWLSVQMTEDGERFIRAKDTRDEQHSHRAQCHEIRRCPLSKESSEDRRHQREHDDEMKSVDAHGSVADFNPRAVFADNAADHCDPEPQPAFGRFSFAGGGRLALRSFLRHE